MEQINFGGFVRQLRIERGYSLRKMAQTMDYSPTYWSDIENGRRNPPGFDKLEKLCRELSLSPDKEATLYDLAGEFEQSAPPDLTDYILDPAVRRALRTAKKHNVDPQRWSEFEQSIIGSAELSEHND